jgi:hypothetical protein
MLSSTSDYDRKAVHPLSTGARNTTNGVAPWGYQSESGQWLVYRPGYSGLMIEKEDLRQATTWVTKDLRFPAKSRQNLNTVRPES